MRDDTRGEVEAFWRDVFGVPEEQLWRQVTVRHPHTRLGSYVALAVARRCPENGKLSGRVSGVANAQE